jgi:cytochrome c oxidase subunit 2
MVPEWRTVVRAGLLLVLALALGGCMIPPDPATDRADATFGLYIFVFTLAAIVFIGVEGFIIYAILRYRRRDDRLPSQLHGNNLVEFIWTAIPSVIVLIIFVMSLNTLATVEAKDPDPAVTVEVDGFQWQWTFRYLDEDGNDDNDLAFTGSATDPPTMVLPVGEPIKLILNSDDVIHSFFVPHFLIKRDVVPYADESQNNELEFTINEVGIFAGQCAEFCGTAHAEMTFHIQSMARADYDAWLAAARAGESAPPQASVPADAPVVELNANQVAFDTDRIEVPAGTPFIIRFTNQEALPHNVGIYDGDQELFLGETITGPDETIEYQVPALEAGEYDFLCTIHPNMNGTLVAQ